MEYSAKSWNELVDIVKQLKANMKNPDQLWFRGQTNSSFLLLPGLLRFRNGLYKEEFLFQKFRKLSYRVFPRRTEDWETLFDMQHYGIPTRLLDWSETLGIAAFFAATYNIRSQSGSDAAIFLLDPLELNKYSGIQRIPIIPDDPDFHYRNIYWHKKPFAPNFPIAIEPLFLNDRILAQRGMFTVHGDNTTAIEDLCSNAVKKVVLSQACLPEIIEFLEIMNINESTVFPDIRGVVDYIRGAAQLQP